MHRPPHRPSLPVVARTATATLLLTTGLAQAATLEVTAWKGNEAEPAALPELIERFEAAHPDITIDFSYISRSDTDIVLPPRLQGGDAPDVMMADMPLVDIWSQAGLLAPLDKGDWYQRLDPAVRTAVSDGDEVYIMPLEVIGMGNFVNMGLLREAGIDQAPRTVEQLKAACTALSQAGVKPMIFAGGFSAPLFTIANGLEPDPGAAPELGTEQRTFEDDEAFDAALSLIPELAEAGCFDPEVQAGVDPWSTGLAEFKAGNFAMMPQGAWNIRDFSSVDGLDFVFAPIPSANDTGVALDLFGVGWVISSQSENADAARAFVDFFTEPDNLQALLEAESAYSPFTDGASGMAALAAPYDEARAAGASIQFPFGVLHWPKPLESEIFDSLTGYLLDLDQSPAEVLSRWDEIIEDQY